MTNRPTYTSGGYTCDRCGEWVPVGIIHVCKPTEWRSGTYPTYPNTLSIEYKLDKIIELLEKIYRMQR